MARLRPSEIRFTQDNIAPEFDNGGSVNDAALAVRDGKKSPDDFPAIRIHQDDESGKNYSWDNRRLYVYRVAEYVGTIDSVKVKYVKDRPQGTRRFTTWNDGRELYLRRRAVTHPHCRPDWLTSPLNSPVLREIQPSIPTRSAGTVANSNAEGVPFVQSGQQNGNDVRIEISDERSAKENNENSWCSCTIL